MLYVTMCVTERGGQEERGAFPSREVSAVDWCIMHPDPQLLSFLLTEEAAHLFCSEDRPVAFHLFYEDLLRLCQWTFVSTFYRI